MQLCKAQLETGEVRVGVVAEGHVRFLDLEDFVGLRSLSDVLHSAQPLGQLTQPHRTRLQVQHCRLSPGTPLRL